MTPSHFSYALTPFPSAARSHARHDLTTPFNAKWHTLRMIHVGELGYNIMLCPFFGGSFRV